MPSPERPCWDVLTRMYVTTAVLPIIDAPSSLCKRTIRSFRLWTTHVLESLRFRFAYLAGAVVACFGSLHEILERRIETFVRSPVYSQLRTSLCTALTDTMCQRETRAPQQRAHL